MKKKDLIINIIVIGAILMFFIVIIWLASFIKNNEISELRDGTKAIEFCNDKCGNYDVITSNNNSQYNFIRCECVIDTNIDASPISGAKSKIRTEVHYFDSKSFEEISRKEVLSRIEVS